MNFPKSDDLYARAQKIMTPVTQTLAKGPGQYTKGASPKRLYILSGDVIIC